MLTEVSETSLDAYIPSFPGSPRSFIAMRSLTSMESDEERTHLIEEANDYINMDNVYLEAAELGDHQLLETLLSEGKTDIHQLDHLGRNALHLAVGYGNLRAIALLVNAGINPNVKDNMGMTPLSLCLIRNPSLRVANLLFEHGATILPRVCPMDTGLFIQFAMMCIPTVEDEMLLELLVRKGAVVNDPDAPGGRQALHIAAMSNNTQLIHKLVELGAKLRVRNNRGETPLQFAMIFKCKEAVDLLEKLETEYPDQSSSSSSIGRESEVVTPTSFTTDSNKSGSSETARTRTVTIKEIQH